MGLETHKKLNITLDTSITINQSTQMTKTEAAKRDELAQLIQTLELVAPSVAKIVKSHYHEGSKQLEVYKGINLVSLLSVGLLSDLEDAINS